MRRLRVIVDVMTAIRCDFSPRGPARRQALTEARRDDPLVAALFGALIAGADRTPPEAFETPNVQRVLGLI